MGRLSGSGEAAASLQRKVVLAMWELEQLQEEWRQTTQRLATTDHDDSMAEAEYYGLYLRQCFQKLMPQVTEVVGRLDAYIQFIHKIERGIHASSSLSVYTPGVSEKTSVQTWTLRDGGAVYDSPTELGKKLRQIQPSGCCGLCAIENVSVESGRHITLNDLFAYAKSQTPPLCMEGGGTTAEGRKKILEAFGIGSTLEEQTIQNIASAVVEGRGVILSVNASKLSPYRKALAGRPLKKSVFCPHAVVVTSVEVDGNGNVTHLVVSDSNAQTLSLTGAIRYTVDEITTVLNKNRKMNVTVPLR